MRSRMPSARVSQSCRSNAWRGALDGLDQKTYFQEKDRFAYDVVKSKGYDQGLHFVGKFAYGIGYPNNPTGIGVGDKIAQAMKGE